MRLFCRISPLLILPLILYSGKAMGTMRSSQAEGLIVRAEGGAALRVMPGIEIEADRYDRWHIVYGDKKSGNAFGNEPVTGSFPGQGPITGFEGKRFVNSKRRNLGTFTGELRSDVFTIQGDRIDFLIGGGRFKNLTCINLWVKTGSEFEQVRNATGDDNLDLRRKAWDVSAYKGKEAYLQILDRAPIEPFSHTPGMSPPEQDFGFILVDDIRQLDDRGNRVCAEADEDHNFNFERLREPRYPITAEAPTVTGTGIYRQAFTVKGHGEFRLTVTPERIDAALTRLHMEWTYTGEPLPGVKFALTVALPVRVADNPYYLFPGVLYNGNSIGQATHYFGEDFPEDATTVPGCFAIENAAWVYGGWIAPQRNQADPRTSVRLQKNVDNDGYEAVYLIPNSAQYGHTIRLDSRKTDLDTDDRLTVRDGFRLTKTFFLYAGEKRTIAGLSNAKQGYGQVIQAAWNVLYPQSPTNPPHTLTDDFNLRLHTLLDPYNLMQEVTLGGRTYRIWFVGRWTLPDDFDFKAHPFVPIQYFHRYTGFSWSGMLGLASYTALKEYLKTANPEALRVATDTLDFFADNGLSPLGILYGAYYEFGGHGGGADGFGTYAQTGAIDMMPLGEECYWYLRCFKLLTMHGAADKHNWLRGVRSSLDKVMELFPDGDIPGRIDGKTGQAITRYVPVLGWKESEEPEVVGGKAYYEKPSKGGPTGFIYLIWAYAAYYRLTGDKRYLDYAERLGDRLLTVMNTYGVMAGAEMDWFNVDKRMPHAALAAFNHLYAATGEKRWLEAAKLAGNLFATWQYAYNVCFDGYEHLPLGHFHYHSVGGTPVSVIAQTNNLAFAQGATEYLRLWNATGEKTWFERARALLHQGTESTLTEDKRKWLNAHFQGPGSDHIKAFNPRAEFDPHVLGGGTEDVLLSWEMKGNWTSKHAPIYSMYMAAQSFDWDDIRREFGSLTYSFRWNYGDALDTLDQVRMTRQGDRLEIVARNMIAKATTYTFMLLDFPGTAVTIDGRTYNRHSIEEGIPLPFSPHQTRKIEVHLNFAGT